MKEMDPLVWFGKRQVSPLPRHFVKTSVPSNTDIHTWVITNLKGRFSLVSSSGITTLNDWGSYYFFENPAEAMLFELRWSGN
jgi:hypothetical protein